MIFWISLLLFLLTSLIGLLCNFLMLPGNWIMTGAAVVLVLSTDLDSGPTWTTVIICTVLAAFGEVLELLLGSAQAARRGASRRGLLLSLALSIAGSLAGSLVIPIPLIGTAAGALLGAAAGAFAGAWLGEFWIGTESAKRLEIGQAAMTGRVWGMLAKIAVGILILTVQVVSFVRWS